MRLLRTVPPEIEHSVVWTRQAIFHPAIIPEDITKRMDRDGMWGFTGSVSPPPSPSNLATCLPALAEWDVPSNYEIKRKKSTPEEDELVRRACEGVHEFVKLKWPETLWETAWFVNPPVCAGPRSIWHFTHAFRRPCKAFAAWLTSTSLHEGKQTKKPRIDNTHRFRNTYLVRLNLSTTI